MIQLYSYDTLSQHDDPVSFRTFYPKVIRTLVIYVDPFTVAWDTDYGIGATYFALALTIDELISAGADAGSAQSNNHFRVAGKTKSRRIPVNRNKYFWPNRCLFSLYLLIRMERLRHLHRLILSRLASKLFELQYTDHPSLLTEVSTFEDSGNTSNQRFLMEHQTPPSPGEFVG